MAKIVITPRGFANYGLDIIERLKSEGYEVDFNNTGKAYSREVFLDKMKEATGAIVGVDSCDQNLLEQCPNLKAVVKFGVGIDNIDVEYASTHGIKVGRCVGTNSNAVAELTIGLLFDLARKITFSISNVKEGKWDKMTGTEVLGKTLGIVGFGHIGQQVARMGKGLGMKIIAYDAFEIENREFVDEVSSLDELIKNSDFISIHVPLLKNTYHLFDEKRINLMRPTAFLINAARGGIVDEYALFNALSSKRIAGAASDVFEDEPPKSEGWVNALLQMDNFLLTPHIASRTIEAERNTVLEAKKVLVELLGEE